MAASGSGWGEDGSVKGGVPVANQESKRKASIAKQQKDEQATGHELNDRLSAIPLMRWDSGEAMA
jgi:hypothetical protein